MAPPPSTQPLGLVSFGGSLPLALAKTLQAAGTGFHCIFMEGITDPGLRAYPHTPIRFFQVGKMLDGLRKAGCESIVFVGQLFRPNIFKMRFDFTTLRHLPVFLHARAGGDDAVLKKVTRAYEHEGFRVLSLKDVAPTLVAQSGQMGRHGLSSQMQSDAAFGMRSMHAFGKYDVGQAIIVDRRRVIAVEAVEGTDEMLRRVEGLRGTVRYPAPRRSGVLVKAAKPQQHLRDDMPVIGINTVRNAIAAGLEAIAIESGRVVTADLPDMVALANEHQLAIVGVTGDGDD
jgi:DUF1009 family protein